MFWISVVETRVPMQKLTKKWEKVFQNGLSKFYGRQPLKNLKGYNLLKHFTLKMTHISVRP